MGRVGQRAASTNADREARQRQWQDRTRCLQRLHSPPVASHSRVGGSEAPSHRSGASTAVPGPRRRPRAAPAGAVPRQEGASTRQSAASAIPGHVPHRSSLRRAAVPGGRDGRGDAATRRPVREWLRRESSSSSQEPRDPRAELTCGASHSQRVHRREAHPAPCRQIGRNRRNGEQQRGRPAERPGVERLNLEE